MDTSFSDENARLMALLQEQQATIRKMAEYNRLLSQRVAAYASEINRLKALVAKLQRMQFGKSSEKLREKTARQVREAEERISALQEEMAEVLGEQHDPVLPQPLRQSSARKPLPASLPRETRTLQPPETACPACGGELSALRGVALGRKNWLFAGSDTGGERAAILYSLIATCRLNGVDPETWLRYVIGHIQDWPVNRLRDLLPWKVDLTQT
jgi:hypothetical protein